jgi:hypothetical protein
LRKANTHKGRACEKTPRVRTTKAHTAHSHTQVAHTQPEPHTRRPPYNTVRHLVSLSGRDHHLDAPEPLERGDYAVARLAGLRVAPMPKARPVWKPASAGQVAEVRGCLRRDLALRGGEEPPENQLAQAGATLFFAFTECCTSAPLRQSGPWPR